MRARPERVMRSQRENTMKARVVFVMLGMIDGEQATSHVRPIYRLIIMTSDTDVIRE